MRFAIITGVLALCSSIAALPSTVKPQTGSITASHALSVINSLHASLLPYEKNINDTIAALGSAPSSAQTSAALTTVNQDLKAMTSAAFAAIDALDDSPAHIARQSSDPVSEALEVAIELVSQEITYSVNQISAAFKTGDITQVIISLQAPVDYLIFFVAFAFLGGEPFLSNL